MRLVYACNLMIRRFGKLKFFTDIKLMNGMIRNNWNICTFSDRDIAKFTAPLNIKPLGLRNANRHFIETCINFKPDIIVIGHCDIITNNTLKEIQKLLPGVPIAYYNIDALWIDSNVKKIKHRKEVVNSIFLTTGGESLKKFRTSDNIVCYIPNAVDPCIEQHDNSTKVDFERDLIYCGVGDKSDERYPLIVNLHDRLKNKIRFDTYGIHGHAPVWGEEYEQLISTSKMALNLNRCEGWPLYSSDRIAQLMGNGLLTFLWDKGDMRRLFTDDHVVFFKDEDELVNKIVEFQHNDTKRQEVASQGRSYYHKNYSAQLVIKFIVEKTLGIPNTQDYIWTESFLSSRE